MIKLSLPSVISIIPVFQDLPNLLKVLSKFNDQTVDELCIVIDSVANKDLDSIKTIIDRMEIPVSIISRKKRKGVGSAIRQRIRYALSREYEIAVPVSKTYPYSHKGGYSKISPLRDWWSITGPLIYLALGIKK